MVDRIISESAKAGKAVTGSGSMDTLAETLALGRRMVTVSPRGYFQSAAPQFLKDARALAKAKGYLV